MQPWYQRNPNDIDFIEANEILEDASSRMFFPQQFENLLASVKSKVEDLKQTSQRANPLAWIQPSYEQTLKLNAWLYGIDIVVDFDANRTGKTAGAIINALLWLIPNNEEWVMFKPYTDHEGRTFQTIPRPPISAIEKLRRKHEQLGLPKPDPKLPFSHPTNVEYYNAYESIKDSPHAPPNRRRTVWVGAPTNQFQEQIMMPEWKKWLPQDLIVKYSVYEHLIVLAPTNDDKQEVFIHFKSYDAADTTWSGAAVDGIMLTEGMPQQVFNEIRQRFKYPGFGGWDYTPYEARNTASKAAIAYKVYTGEEHLPLHPYVFSGFGIESTPTYILPTDKKEDLIKMWKGKAEGEARIKGLFYTNSPILVKNYSPSHHALVFSFVDLQKKYAPLPLHLFRGLDPGWGHVTACCWMALAPDNTRYIYRFYAESQKTIEERCEDIIAESGNIRIQNPKPNARDQYIERPTTQASGIKATFCDYHTFKTDEQTGRPFANNYIRNGLIIRPSDTFTPRQRIQILNNRLALQAHIPHPEKKVPPGSQLYFLINEPGVAEAMHKIENLFWATFEKGEKRGLTKDVPPDINDDELDALCYVACPDLTYSSFSTSQKNKKTNETVLTTKQIQFV